MVPVTLTVCDPRSRFQSYSIFYSYSMSGMSKTVQNRAIVTIEH